jgi:hypothetical protein
MTTQVTITKAKTSFNPPFTPEQSFSQRQLRITITLAPNGQNGQPSTFADGSDTVTLEGFRTSVRVTWAGTLVSYADIKIFGLTQDMMNRLSALGFFWNQTQKNFVTVAASNASGGYTTVFGGTILTALPIYSGSPNVMFSMTCQTGYIDAVLPASASSFPQPTSVATIMSGLAALCSPALTFENNNVNVTLPPTYLSGTARQQIATVARHANIDVDIVDGGTKLAIWPKGGSRTSLQGQDIPLISSTTGMIGYPSLQTNGFMVIEALYNPLIIFKSIIQVQSEVVPQANATWVVHKVDFALDALVPGGQWKQTLACYKPVIVNGSFAPNNSAPPPP